MGTTIIGTGNYTPAKKVSNLSFQQSSFLDKDGTLLKSDNSTITHKLKEITGIEERRYAPDEQVASDLGFLAAQAAIADARIDPETLDYIIFAHNFGDVTPGSIQSDMVPSLASRVKHQLKIQHPYCVAYDVLFGCPGWIEGVIQAHAFIKAGMARRCLVIGAETLSRVSDPHDRDSMIYADGAGAVVLESSSDDGGIRSHISASFTRDEVGYLYFGAGYSKDDTSRYIKMNGRKIYEFALSNVPPALKKCYDQSGFPIHQLKKIIIHQANEKMDEAIIDRFYKLYDTALPEGIMPMVIGKLGNSSVATVPTLLSMILKNELPEHHIQKGDIVLFASVGAGMNVNAFVYQY